MLSEADIRDRLQDGSLSIFPLDEKDITSEGVSIRIGTDVAELPREAAPRTWATLDIPVPPSEVRHTLLGERIVLHPNSILLVASLQIVTLPADLTGFILPRPSTERVGLSVTQAVLAPSFAGKVTLTLRNFGRLPIALYAGLRIATLSFFAMQNHAAATASPPADAETPTPEEDVQSLRRTIASASEGAKADYKPPTPLGVLLAEALGADTSTKGKKLEVFAGEMLRSIEGLKIIRSNAHLRAEELDILVQNDLAVGFWRSLGSPFLVECKNWSAKVGASDVASLEGKLASLGRDVKSVLLIAPMGITGDSRNDAWLKIRELRQRGVLVIVLDSKRLEAIRAGQHPADTIEEAYQAIWLI